MMSEDRGVLYVVGTPLGNLDDLSGRARQTLASVDLVAAEDTRRTRGLLSSIGLNRPLIAYHEHNELRQTERLLRELEQGRSVALVSDAGTPLISDPGYRLVSAAVGAGLSVVCVPGPSALTAALSICGIPAERFAFEGFLPRRSAARRERLAALRGETRTLVFYEAVHRVAATMADLVAAFGPNRLAAIARELTKLHESLDVGSLEELTARLGERIPLKGEFVIVVAGSSEERTGQMADAERIFELLHAELPAATAAKLTAKITGLSRREAYLLTRSAGD
jgi:16S rRNA (cytidine1402-2'-O)-methyltransferase